MIKPAAYLKYIVLILPILFLIAGINFNRGRYVNDPEYIYLMNSLCINDGKSVGHIDNPGTTVMQIAAATNVVMHLFSNPENETLINHVIHDPDRFLEGIRIVFVVLNSLILLLLGWIAVKKTHSVWLALLLQASTFVSANTLDHVWSKISPEPLLFFVSSVYVLLILLYYFEENKNQWKYVLLFALVTGAGLGTKATFLPLTIFPFIVLPGFKKKISYWLGIIPSFVLFTIPAIPEYGHMYFWFKNMISHSGKYGNGEKGIIDMQTFLPNIITILKDNPLITLVVAVGIIVLGFNFFQRKKKEIDWDSRFLSGLLGTAVFGILLVAKHYGGNHYLIPVLLLSGIAVYFIINLINTIFNSKKLFYILLPASVFVLIFLVAWHQPSKMWKSNLEYKGATMEIDSVNSMIENNYADYVRINYYVYSLNKFTALKFGNDYAKGKLRPYLIKMYPFTYFYEFSKNQFLNWNTETTLDGIVERHGNKILLLNGPNDLESIEEMEKRGFPLKKIYSGRSQQIYELDTLKYTPLGTVKIQQVENEITFDAESFTPDGKFFLGSNLEVFGSSDSKSTQFARSGIYSIKVDELNPYAVNYEIKNVQYGDVFEIVVWKKTDVLEGFLVATTDNVETYYNAQKQPSTSDSKGWEMIRTEVEITSKMDGKTLKIYVWNPLKKSVYFDDLTIKKIKYTVSRDSISASGLN